MKKKNAKILASGAGLLLMPGCSGSDAGKNILVPPAVNFSFIHSHMSGCHDLTLFRTAIACRNSDTVRHYLDMGADVELRVNSTYYLNPRIGGINSFINIAGYTPLHLATAMNESYIVEMLLKHGAHTEFCITPYGSTPLMNAALFGERPNRPAPFSVRGGSARRYRLDVLLGSGEPRQGGHGLCVVSATRRMH